MLQLAANKGITKVIDDFHRDCALMKFVFGRVGSDYELAPTPVIWAARVRRDLDEHYLQPKGEAYYMEEMLPIPNWRDGRNTGIANNCRDSPEL